MSGANGGTIVVQLELENGQYRVATVQAGALMRDLGRNVENTAKSVTRLEESQNSLSRKFRDLVLTMGNLRFVAMDINDIFLRLPMAILKTGGELERMQQLMVGLSKETETFKRKAEGLRDFNFVVGMAKGAPFEIAALSDAFVKLKTGGIDPASGSMSALVDSVARFGGTGETLKRASIAIQQMAGKGVVSMEELRQQLGEAVPTAMQDMADGMNMSMAQLAKAVSKGTVEAGPALNKMLLRMKISNAGAAAEMMETWVGMTAQLKTEWDLTAKHIADSGFSAAAKKAVADLTAFLQSGELQRFGVDAGAALGDFVKNAVDLTKTLIKYREEIGNLVKAWLAYKAVFSIIAPMGNAAQAMMKSSIRTLGDERRAIVSNAVERQRMAVEGAAAMLREQNARTARLTAVMAENQRELMIVRARNAAVLAEEARLQGQLTAMRAKERNNGANNIGAQQRTLRDIDSLARQNSTLIARERELAASVAATSTAMNASSQSAARKLTQLRSLMDVTRLQTIATAAMTATVRAGSAAMALVGGPIGVAIIAITGLVYAWGSARRAAEAYTEAARMASLGMAGDNELRTLVEANNEAVAKFKRAKAESEKTVVGTSRGGVRGKNTDERAKDQAELAAARKEMDEKYRAMGKGQISAMELRARDVAAAEDVLARRASEQAQARFLQENLKLQKQKQDYLNGAGKTDDEKVRLARTKEIQDQQSALLKKSLEERIAIEESYVKKAMALAGKSKVGTQERTAADRIIADRTASMEQLNAELKWTNDTLDSKVKVGEKAGAGTGSKNKGPVDSPMQKLVERLKADRARLEAELDGFDELTGKGDKAAGVIAKLKQQFENGNFDNKGKRDQAGFDKAMAIALENEKIKSNLEAQKKAVEDAEKVTSMIEQLRPAYEDALELLADPLGANKAGTTERRVAAFLARNTEAVKAWAVANKSSVEQLTADLKNHAQTIDMAGAFQEMAKDTAEMNAVIVDDSRDAAKKRMEAENERYRNSMQNMINERAAMGASPADIAARQAELNKNTAARTNAIANKFKSPMQAMLEEWQNVTKNMEEASVGWLSKTADGFVELAMTGKANFADLAKSVIADIIKIQAQKLLAQAATSVMGFFGFADGGIMTSGGSAPLKKYAAGGIANSPQLALFGEGRLPEAYVPLPDGRTIPVTMKGGGVGAGGGGNVEINIQINRDGTESATTVGDDVATAKKMSERIRGVVREELVMQQRPGGSLYK